MERTSTPGIYKRGGRYVVVWRHRGKQHKSYHRTLAEAREAQGDRRRPEGRTPMTRLRFEEYADEWLNTYAGTSGRGLSPSTRRDYRRSIERHSVPFFEGYRLAEIEPRDVRRFIVHLESAGQSPASVVKNLVPLRVLFTTAVEDGMLRYNPAAGVRVNPRRDNESSEAPEAKAMTRKQLAAVLLALPKRWRLFFTLLAETGLRISEALGLDWEDVVQGSSSMLRVRRQYYRGDLKRLKSHNGRRDLPLSKSMARALGAMRPAHGSGPVFRTANGTRLSDRNVRRVLDTATEKVGLEWVSFHTFRHTAASMLFDAGKTIRQVAGWLGHSDPSFTLRTYVHLMDSGLGGPFEWSNPGATHRPESPANEEPVLTAESAG